MSSGVCWAQMVMHQPSGFSCRMRRAMARRRTALYCSQKASPVLARTAALISSSLSVEMRSACSALRLWAPGASCSSARTDSASRGTGSCRGWLPQGQRPVFWPCSIATQTSVVGQSPVRVVAGDGRGPGQNLAGLPGAADASGAVCTGLAVYIGLMLAAVLLRPDGRDRIPELFGRIRRVRWC